jgi:hypothetical protein
MVVRREHNPPCIEIPPDKKTFAPVLAMEHREGPPEETKKEEKKRKEKKKTHEDHERWIDCLMD